MVLITITRWRKKLVALMVCLLFLIGLGFSLNWFLSSEDNTTVAPSNNLQNDVLTQPVKVQGQPGTAKEPTQPTAPAPKK